MNTYIALILVVSDLSNNSIYERPNNFTKKQFNFEVRKQ